MTNATMLAPTGTIREFLNNLGIDDDEAVHSVNIDSVGVITVALKIRDIHGRFIAGTRSDSSLPVVFTATLHFAETSGDDEEDVRYDSAGSYLDGKEVRTIQAYSTKQAIDALDITTSGKANNFELTDDTGQRGKLRTFTFVRL